MSEEQAFELALDQALQMRAAGESVEACLARFPQYAEELALLLEAAEFTREGLLADGPIPTPNLARGRQRFLQSARLMSTRRSPAAAPRRVAARFGGFRRNVFRFATAGALALALVVVAGAGVSVAATRALPGDVLYPVKLGLEGARLAVTINPAARAELEITYAARRRAEVQTLLENGREADVAFEGVVEAVGKDSIVISGLTVRTDITDEVRVGDHVRVEAETSTDGEIVASDVRLQDQAEGPAQPTPAARDLPPSATLTGAPTDVRPASDVSPTQTPERDRAQETQPAPEPTRSDETRPADVRPTPTPAERDAQDATRSSEGAGDREPTATPTDQPRDQDQEERPADRDSDS